eukprot:gene11063-biopygen6879
MLYAHIPLPAVVRPRFRTLSPGVFPLPFDRWMSLKPRNIRTRPLPSTINPSERERIRSGPAPSAAVTAQTASIAPTRSKQGDGNTVPNQQDKLLSTG